MGEPLSYEELKRRGYTDQEIIEKLSSYAKDPEYLKTMDPSVAMGLLQDSGYITGYSPTKPQVGSGPPAYNPDAPMVMPEPTYATEGAIEGMAKSAKLGALYDIPSSVMTSVARLPEQGAANAMDALYGGPLSPLAAARSSANLASNVARFLAGDNEFSNTVDKLTGKKLEREMVRDMKTAEESFAPTAKMLEWSKKLKAEAEKQTANDPNLNQEWLASGGSFVDNTLFGVARNSPQLVMTMTLAYLTRGANVRTEAGALKYPLMNALAKYAPMAMMEGGDAWATADELVSKGVMDEADAARFASIVEVGNSILEGQSGDLLVEAALGEKAGKSWLLNRIKEIGSKKGVSSLLKYKPVQSFVGESITETGQTVFPALAKRIQGMDPSNPEWVKFVTDPNIWAQDVAEAAQSGWVGGIAGSTHAGGLSLGSKAWDKAFPGKEEAKPQDAAGGTYTADDGKKQGQVLPEDDNAARALLEASRAKPGELDLEILRRKQVWNEAVRKQKSGEQLSPDEETVLANWRDYSEVLPNDTASPLMELSPHIALAQKLETYDMRDKAKPQQVLADFTEGEHAVYLLQAKLQNSEGKRIAYLGGKDDGDAMQRDQFHRTKEFLRRAGNAYNSFFVSLDIIGLSAMNTYFSNKAASDVFFDFAKVRLYENIRDLMSNRDGHSVFYSHGGDEGGIIVTGRSGELNKTILSEALKKTYAEIAEISNNKDLADAMLAQSGLTKSDGSNYTVPADGLNFHDPKTGKMKRFGLYFGVERVDPSRQYSDKEITGADERMQLMKNLLALQAERGQQPDWTKAFDRANLGKGDSVKQGEKVVSMLEKARERRMAKEGQNVGEAAAGAAGNQAGNVTPPSEPGTPPSQSKKPAGAKGKAPATGKPVVGAGGGTGTPAVPGGTGSSKVEGTKQDPVYKDVLELVKKYKNPAYANAHDVQQALKIGYPRAYKLLVLAKEELSPSKPAKPAKQAKQENPAKKRGKRTAEEKAASQAAKSERDKEIAAIQAELADKASDLIKAFEGLTNKTETPPPGRPALSARKTGKLTKGPSTTEGESKGFVKKKAVDQNGIEIPRSKDSIKLGAVLSSMAEIAVRLSVAKNKQFSRQVVLTRARIELHRAIEKLGGKARLFSVISALGDGSVSNGNAIVDAGLENMLSWLISIDAEKFTPAGKYTVKGKRTHQEQVKLEERVRSSVQPGDTKLPAVPLGKMEKTVDSMKAFQLAGVPFTWEGAQSLGLTEDQWVAMSRALDEALQGASSAPKPKAGEGTEEYAKRLSEDIDKVNKLQADYASGLAIVQKRSAGRLGFIKEERSPEMEETLKATILELDKFDDVGDANQTLLRALAAAAKARERRNFIAINNFKAEHLTEAGVEAAFGNLVKAKQWDPVRNDEHLQQILEAQGYDWRLTHGFWTLTLQEGLNPKDFLKKLKNDKDGKLNKKIIENERKKLKELAEAARVSGDDAKYQELQRAAKVWGAKTEQEVEQIARSIENFKNAKTGEWVIHLTEEQLLQVMSATGEMTGLFEALGQIGSRISPRQILKDLIKEGGQSQWLMGKIYKALEGFSEIYQLPEEKRTEARYQATADALATIALAHIDIGLNSMKGNLSDMMKFVDDVIAADKEHLSGSAAEAALRFKAVARYVGHVENNKLTGAELKAAMDKINEVFVETDIATVRPSEAREIIANMKDKSGRPGGYEVLVHATSPSDRWVQLAVKPSNYKQLIIELNRIKTDMNGILRFPRGKRTDEQNKRLKDLAARKVEIEREMLVRYEYDSKLHAISGNRFLRYGPKERGPDGKVGSGGAYFVDKKTGKRKWRGNIKRAEGRTGRGDASKVARVSRTALGIALAPNTTRLFVKKSQETDPATGKTHDVYKITGVVQGSKIKRYVWNDTENIPKPERGVTYWTARDLKGLTRAQFEEAVRRFYHRVNDAITRDSQGKSPRVSQEAPIRAAAAKKFMNSVGGPETREDVIAALEERKRKFEEEDKKNYAEDVQSQIDAILKESEGVGPAVESGTVEPPKGAAPVDGGDLATRDELIRLRDELAMLREKRSSAAMERINYAPNPNYDPKFAAKLDKKIESTLKKISKLERGRMSSGTLSPEAALIASRGGLRINIPDVLKRLRQLGLTKAFNVVPGPVANSVTLVKKDGSGHKLVVAMDRTVEDVIGNEDQYKDYMNKGITAFGSAWFRIGDDAKWKGIVKLAGVQLNEKDYGQRDVVDHEIFHIASILAMTNAEYEALMSEFRREGDTVTDTFERVADAFAKRESGYISSGERRDDVMASILHAVRTLYNFAAPWRRAQRVMDMVADGSIWQRELNNPGLRDMLVKGRAGEDAAYKAWAGVREPYGDGMYIAESHDMLFEHPWSPLNEYADKRMEMAATGDLGIFDTKVGSSANEQLERGEIVFLEANEVDSHGKFWSMFDVQKAIDEGRSFPMRSPDDWMVGPKPGRDWKEGEGIPRQKTQEQWDREERAAMMGGDLDLGMEPGHRGYYSARQVGDKLSSDAQKLVSEGLRAKDIVTGNIGAIEKLSYSIMRFGSKPEAVLGRFKYGRKFIDLIDQAFAISRRRAAEMSYHLEMALEVITDDKKGEVISFGWNGKKMTMTEYQFLHDYFAEFYDKGIPMPSKNLKAVAKAWEVANSEVAKWANEAGLLGKDDIISPKRYVPRRFTDEARTQILAREGPIYDALKLKFGDNIHMFANAKIMERMYSSLDFKRTHDIPWAITDQDGTTHRVLDTSPVNLFLLHIKKASNRIATEQVFGKGFEENVVGLDPGDRDTLFAAIANHEGEAIADKMEWLRKKITAESMASKDIWAPSSESIAKEMKAVWDMFQGRHIHGQFIRSEASKGGRKIYGVMSDLDTLAKALMLSKASLQNFFAGWQPIYQRHGAVNTAKAFANSFVAMTVPSGKWAYADEQKDIARKLKMLGAFHGNVINQLSMTEGMEGFSGKVANAILKYTGFGPVNAWITQAAAYAALELDLIDRVEGLQQFYSRTQGSGALLDEIGAREKSSGLKEESDTAHWNNEQYRFLRRNYRMTHAEVLQLAAYGLNGKGLPVDVRAKIVQRAADLANAIGESPTQRTRQLIISPWWNLALAFTSFMRKQVDQLEESVQEFKLGNAKPLARMLFSGIVSQEVATAAINAIIDREREDDKTMKGWLLRLIKDIIGSGIFGIAGTMQGALSRSNKRGLPGVIENVYADLLPPTISFWGEASMAIYDEVMLDLRKMFSDDKIAHLRPSPLLVFSEKRVGGFDVLSRYGNKLLGINNRDARRLADMTTGEMNSGYMMPKVANTNTAISLQNKYKDQGWQSFDSLRKRVDEIRKAKYSQAEEDKKLREQAERRLILRLNQESARR